VYVYYGSSTGIAATPAWGTESDRSDVKFASSIAIGDVNGDGYGDLVVGAPYYSNPTTEEGRIFLYPSSSAGFTSATWFKESDTNGAHFGNALAMGDRNGDGYADVAVGIADLSHTDGAGTYVLGGWRLYEGSSAGLPATPSLSNDGGEDVHSDQRVLHWGSTLAFSADTNGDGLSALATSGISAEGYGLVSVNDLNAVGLFARALQPGTSTPISPAGKSASRAVDIRVRARTSQGRARVKLQVEVKHRATAFNGSGLITSASWTDTTIPASNLTLAVTGLAAATAYHWRARLVYDPSANITMSRSRWYYGGLVRNGTHFRTP